MNKIISSKINYRLLTRIPRYNFCYDWAPLDPRKHNTMNHYFNNMYLDLYEYGQYQDLYLVCSTAARTYEPKVIHILATALNQLYGTNVTAQYLQSKRQRGWDKLLSKDLNIQQQFHYIYPTLLSRLASNLIIKQSRFTWVVEQSIRKQYTINYFDTDTPKTVEDFINNYNKNIQSLILLSNFGFAAQIDQQGSAISKHEQDQFFAQTYGNRGVDDLKNLSQQNNTFINKLLAYIH